MNRVIKFRVWVKVFNHMRNTIPNSYSISLNGKVINLDINQEIESFILLQFTGLLDKNGKEIYEGDIIKGGVRIMTVIFKQEACQFWLVWEKDGKSYYEPLNATYGYGEIFSNDSLEKIGNIYENPKLL